MPKVEGLSVSKTIYKITLGLFKVLPMIMAGLYLTNTVLSYFHIDYIGFSYLAGVGLLPWILLMLFSVLFKFCFYHRLCLWYIILNNIACVADHSFGLPITNWSYLVLHFIVIGFTLFISIYFKNHEEILAKICSQITQRDCR